MLIILAISIFIAVFFLVAESDNWSPIRCALRIQTSAKRVFGTFSESELVRFHAQKPAWRALAQRLQTQLLKCGRDFSIQEAILLLFLGSALIAIFLCWISSNIFVGIIGGLAWYLAIPFIEKHFSQKDREAVQKQLPDAYRSLSSALTSGQTLPQALQYVGHHVDGIVGDSFKKASFQFACGGSTSEAIDIIKDGLPQEGISLLLCALSVSQKTGAPLAHLLEEAAHLMEERHEMLQMLMAKTAQVRFSVQVVMILPVALVLLLALISPDFQAGIATPLGIGSFFMAALLDGFAILSMQRIMRSVMPS